MPRAYTKLTYHCTFSTTDRVPALDEDIRLRLHGYMAALINEEYGFAREIGGVSDHVHILCDIQPRWSVSHVLGRVKSVSSGWMHREFPDTTDVNWQEGYGAFSVSASLVPDVARYIRDQRRHHEKGGFVAEFKRLLEMHGVEFEEEMLL